MESVGTVAEQSLMIIKPRAEILRIVFHCYLFIYSVDVSCFRRKGITFSYTTNVNAHAGVTLKKKTNKQTNNQTKNTWSQQWTFSQRLQFLDIFYSAPWLDFRNSKKKTNKQTRKPQKLVIRWSTAEFCLVKHLDFLSPPPNRRD